jgi:hypothetical protein
LKISNFSGKNGNDEKATARSAVKGFLRAFRSGPQHPTIPTVSDSVLRPLSGGGRDDDVVIVVVVVPAVHSDATDLAGGVRFAASGDLVGADALWVGNLLHRLHIDAMGSRAGHGVLRGRDRLGPLHVRALAYLLRHGATHAAKGHSW